MRKTIVNCSQKLLYSYHLRPSYCKKTGLPLAPNGMPIIYSSNDNHQTEALVAKSVQKILQDIQIPYQDTKSSAVHRSGLLTKVDQLILSYDPNAKVYICGETVQSILGYIYWLLVNEHQKNPECLDTKLLLRDFLNKKPSLNFQEVFGIGKIPNLLILPSETFKNLEPVIQEVKALVNHYRDSIQDDSIKTLFSLCMDVKHYDNHMAFVQKIGGNPLDAIAFPITERSGNNFCQPKHDLSVLDHYFQGKFQYVKAQDPTKTSIAVAKTIDLLFTHPHLTCEKNSSDLFLRDLNGLKKADCSEEFHSIIQTAIQSCRVYNGYLHPCNLIHTSQNPLLKAISNLSDRLQKN